MKIEDRKVLFIVKCLQCMNKHFNQYIKILFSEDRLFSLAAQIMDSIYMYIILLHIKTN